MSTRNNIIFNYIGVVVPIILNFISVPIFIHYLGASSYGLIGISALIQTWVMLLNSALSPVVGRCAAQAAIGEIPWDNVGRLCRTIDWLLIGLITLIVYGGIHFSDFIVSYWFGHDAATVIPQITYCFSFLIFTTLIRLASSVGRGVIQHLDAQMWLNIQMSVFNIFRFCGAMGIAVVSNNIFYVFLFWAVLSLIEYISVQIKVYQLIPKKIPLSVFDFSLLVKQRNIIVPLLTTGFIYAAITNFDKLMLSGKLSLEQYGYFNLVALLASSVILVSSPITQAFQPKIISAFAADRMGKQSDNIIIRRFRLMTAIVVVLIAPVVSIMAVNAKEVVYSWSGMILPAEYCKALGYYALGNAFSVFSSLLYLLQLGKGELRWHVLGYSLLFIVLIPLYYVLVTHSSLLNVSIAWFWVNVIYFLFWGCFIYKKVLGTILFKWFLFDTTFMLIFSLVFVFLASNLLIPMVTERITILLSISGIGLITIFLMVWIHPMLREIIREKI